MNRKSKIEQFFILMMMSVGMLGIFALTGCGGCGSCETPKCASINEDGVKAAGISIPGCGGCLSSERGCDSCLWPQSCKFSCGEWDETYLDKHEKKVVQKAGIKGCDVRYYGDGCLGCGQREKTSYAGCINMNYDGQKLNGFFFGAGNREERLIGCGNGCAGCVPDDHAGEEAMKEMETMLGID